MPRYALIIGIGQYDSFPSLTKPEGDARALCELLRQGDYVEPQLLLNPTQKALVTGLETLLKQARRSDALIYFTGHGFIAGESEEEEEAYLATRNCTVECEEDRLVAPRRALSFKRLNKLIGKSELSNLVMLLDCCHSGHFLKDRLVRSELGAFQERSYCLMAACGAYDKAYAEPHEAHSLFTGAVVEALSTEADCIRVPDLSQVITNRLRGAGQEPTFLWAGNDIVVLRRQRATVISSVSEINPYQGLEAFTLATRQFFFGREKETNKLTQTLSTVNFVPVIGASGSGKSSVVRAGLMDRMMRQGWRVLGPIKPGPRPLDRLQGAFDEVFGNREIGEIYDLIETEGLTAVLPKLPDGRYLLVIDQFEEVFTVCASKKRQRQFVSCITGISQLEDSPLKIVTTMRSDFVTPWLSSDALTKVIQNNVVWLGTLQREPLRMAIEQPAVVQGYEVERELLALIESDVKAEENCLPLLEFALTQLWDERDHEKHVLTAAAYRKMGQLRGALNQRAEQIYNENGENAKGFKTDLEQDWCRRICLELVRIGPEGMDTRRRQQRQDVLDKGKSDKEKETINNVIEMLVEGRLLVADKDKTIDIAHEALMNGWERFADWREADRDRLRLLQRMKDSYEEWQTKSKDNNYLLSKGLLAEVREHWADLKADVTGGLQDYCSCSDEQEKEAVALLKKALAEAQLREERTRINNFPPTKTIDKTLSSIKAIGINLDIYKDELSHPIQDLLNRAWRNTCERLRIQYDSDTIVFAVFSPTGDCLVVGDSDGTLCLWDLEGRQIGHPFKGHTQAITSVAFSPIGDHIVSGSRDGTLRLWNLKGRQIGEPFRYRKSDVDFLALLELDVCVAFSPAGNRIASWSDNDSIEVWNLDGQCVQELRPFSHIWENFPHEKQTLKSFEGHTQPVTCVAFGPDGDWIISGYGDGSIRIWDLIEEKIDISFENFFSERHLGWIESIALSPSSDCIVAGYNDGTIRVWDLEGQQLGQTFRGHLGPVTSVSFNSTGSLIVSGSKDNTVRLWSTNGQQIGQPFTGHSEAITSASFSPCKDWIISSGGDGTIRLWDLDGRQTEQPFKKKANKGFRGLARVIACNALGDQIVAGESDGAIRIWNPQGQQIGLPFRDSRRKDSRRAIQAIAFSPNGEQIISVGKDGILNFWSVASHRLESSFQVHGGRIESAAISYSGKYIVFGGGDRTLQLLNLLNQQIEKIFEGHKRKIRSVALNSSENRIVSGSSDRTLRLWDLSGQQIGKPFKGHTGPVSSVAFSPNEEYIISGGQDATLRLWNLAGEQVVKPFEGHAGHVTSVAFSPNGDYIISGSEDGTLRLWDLTGQQIGRPFEWHSRSIISIAFSPKGNYIASCSSGGSLRVWPGGTWRDWLHTCCDRLMRHPRFTQPTNDDDRQACQVCEKYVWTEPELAQFRIAQGDALAHQGNTNGAIIKYTEAQTLDRSLTFDPQARAQESSPSKA